MESAEWTVYSLLGMVVLQMLYSLGQQVVLYRINSSLKDFCFKVATLETCYKLSQGLSDPGRISAVRGLAKTLEAAEPPDPENFTQPTPAPQEGLRYTAQF